MNADEWIDKPCVLIASGPSLTQQDADRLIFHPDLRSIVVNDAYKVAPWADLLYAGDVGWWKAKAPPFTAFKGERMICDGHPDGSRFKVAKKFGLSRVPLKWGNGLSMDPTFIHAGHCGGFQVLNIAINRGCNPIYLLGYDCKRADDGKLHFFGNHPKPLRNELPFKKMVAAFEKAADQIDGSVEIINLTRDTALECFPRSTVEAVS